MQQRWIRIGAAVLILGLTGLVVRALLPVKETAAQGRLVSSPADQQAGFQRVEGPQVLEFPRDHGPHPEYQTEWWYYTGNLDTADGRHFGYQLTFFRRAMAPPQTLGARGSDWAVGQVYMAHFALTDVAAKRFQSFEKLERGAAGLAGATGEPAYQVWLDDWKVEQVGTDEYRLMAQEGGVEVELSLRDLKGPVLQGERGYSRKGPEPGNASIYYSQTRLESEGTVGVDGKEYPVKGLSWMDHETSTSALSKGQVGWDWFSLQMNDGSELMLFHIRREDGSIDPYSSGSFIARDGSVATLRREDFEIEALGSWKSPRSGAEYPSGWRLRIAKQGIDLEIQPYLADQEHALSYAYWEGAAQFQGTHAGQPVSGAGYVELTGYADAMNGDF